MAKKSRDANATPPNDADPLRGGTQGGGPMNIPGSQPGGTNAIGPAGASHIDGGPPNTATASGGTRNDVREDAADLFEGSRHISQSEAKQLARDDANVDTAARSPHGAGEPRYHQIHADPTKAPGSQGSHEATAPASRGESTGEPH